MHDTANSEWQAVANTLLALAKRQGHITSRDVRAELRMAGLPEERWKDALAPIAASLVLRQGRYYHRDSLSSRPHKEHAQHKAIDRAIKQIIKQHKQRTKNDDRRGQARIDFMQPVKVRTADGTMHTLMSRDLSVTGLRMIGTRRLLGQKVEVELPMGEEATCRLSVRILWTCAVGDDLFENGGSFVELVQGIT